QIGQIGTMSLAGMDDRVALGAHRREHARDRLNGGPGQRKVVAHRIDIAALAAEIGLHVDDDERGVLRLEIAVERPGIRISRNGRHRIVCALSIGLIYLVMLSSPGTSRNAFFDPADAAMMISVRM